VHQFGTKPGAGENPVALCGRQRYPERGRSLRHGQASEETQFHEFCAHGVVLGQAGQGIIDREEIVVVTLRICWRYLVEIDTPPAAAMLDALFSSRLLDQDAAHGLGCGAQKMTTTFPGMLR